MRAEVEKMWIRTATSSYAYMERDNFTVLWRLEALIE
jgi:hypothetical protein